MNVCTFLWLSFLQMNKLSKYKIQLNAWMVGDRINQKIQQDRKMKSNSKQSDQTKDYKSLYESLKRESMENGLTAKNLQATNASLSFDNQRIKQQLDHFRQISQEQLMNLKFHVSVLEDRNKELIIERREMEIKLDHLRISNQTLIQEYQIYRTNKDQQIQDIRKRHHQEKKQFQATYNQYTHAIAQYQKLVAQNSALHSKNINDQQNFKSYLADKERQKMQTLDLVKKDMMGKALQMKNKALQIRREQLDTSTRITFLQNDQLIRQIEYQSCQTEKILNKNTELQKLVKELKRKIEIHEVVEKQIARRNVVAKNLIKKVSDKRDPNNDQEIPPHSSSNPSQKSITSKRPSMNNLKLTSKKQNNKCDENMQYLHKMNVQQSLLDQLERKYKISEGEARKLQEMNEKLKKQKQQIEHKFKVKSTNVLNLLIYYYDQLNKSDQKDIVQDIEQLKEDKVEQWPQQSVRAIVKMLLQAIKPHLGLKLLGHPYYQHKCKQNQIDFQSLKENINVSKYLQALKRRNHRSLYSNKNDDGSEFQVEKWGKKNNKMGKKQIVFENKRSSLSTLQPVNKRFLKPAYKGRI